MQILAAVGGDGMTPLLALLALVLFHDERESGQAMIKTVVSCYAAEELFEGMEW